MTEKKVGRPSKYTPELLDLANEYLLTWKEESEIPSHLGLARHLNIRTSTLYAWGGEEDKREFSDILDKIMQLQGIELLNKGLNGGFNPTIAKLVLGKHGYTDKAQIDESKSNEDITEIRITRVGN